MNPTLSALQGAYGLNAGTIAGLSNIAGYTNPDPVPAGPPQVDGTLPFDPSVNESLPAEIPYTGPGDMRRSLEALGGKPVQGPTDFGNAQPEPSKAVGPVAIQGPAEDSFPTVRPMGEYGDAGVMSASTGATPAHWQNTTHEMTREGGLSSPEVKQDYGQLRAAQQTHEENADMLALKDAKIRGISAGIAKTNEDYVRQQGRAQQIARDEQRQRYVEGQRAAAEQALSDTRANVDPDQLWKQKGTFARVMAAIAVGLGQFGASLTHTENGALKIVDGAIRDNIDGQKSNIANARNRYRDLQDEKTRRLSDFDDEKQKDLVHTAMLLDDSARMVEEWNQKNGYKSQAAAEAMLGGIAKRRADALRDYDQISNGKVTEKEAEKFVPTSTGAPGDKKDHGELYVPTLGGYARTEQDARALNTKGSMRMQMGEGMREINELLEEAKKVGVTSPAKRADIDARIQQRVNVILQRSTVLAGQGAMSEGDKTVAQEANSLKGLDTQGMPSAMIERKQGRVKDVATQMLQDHRIEGEAFGIRKGQEKYEDGPNGPTPVRKLEGRNAVVSKRTQAVDDLVVAPKGVARGR